MEKKRRRSWWFWIGVRLMILSWLRSGAAYAEVVDRIRDDLYAVHFVSADEGWVVGSNGGIYHTLDRGKAWEKQFSDTTEALYAVRFFADGKVGWISGKSGLLLRTSDGGQKWLPAFSDTWHHLFSLDFVDPQHGVVVGDRGTILLTTNGGKTWQDRSVEDVVLYSVKLHSSRRGWIVGERGTVLLTENGGDHWERIATGNTSTLQAVAFAEEHRVCAVGLDGTILQSADGGRNWRRYASPAQTSLYNVAISGTIGWAVGEEGVILNSTDAGRTWKLVQGPDELLRYKFLGLFMGPGDLGVITGTQGIVLFAWGDRIDLAPVAQDVEIRRGAMKCFIAAFMFWMWGTVCLAFAATDETAAVRAVIQKAFDAERTDHADTLPQYFLPEVTGFFLNGTLRTQGLFIPWFQAAYASGYRQNLQVSQLEVTVYDNTAFATGYGGGSISFPGDTADGRTLEGPWRASWVLRKHRGAWKIAHYHYSPLTPTPRRPLAVHFPEAAVNDIYRPAGTGPFPAVVLLHGCAGVLDQQDRWAKTLQGWGYVALIVDSFGPRGVEETCSDSGFSVTSAQRTLDAYAALYYLPSQPFVDPQRVGVMGWSHGGGPVLAAVQESGFQTALDLRQGGFRAAVAWYPYCYPIKSFAVPLLILTGGKDDMAPVVPCIELEAATRGQGVPVTLKVYAGATHAFDIPSPAPVHVLGHVLEYDAQATETATAELRKFLDQHLKGTASVEQAAGK